MILVLGDPGDARGLGLAGARVVRCRSREDVVRSLDDIDAARSPAPSMVMISAPVYALAQHDVDAYRDRRGAPMVLVLPETTG